MYGKPPLFYPAAPEKVAIAAAIRTANSPYHPAPGFPGLDQNRDIKRFRGRQSVSPARQNLVTLACLTPPPAFPAAVAFSRHPWQLAPSDWRIPALSVPDRHPQPPARRHPGSIRAGVLAGLFLSSRIAVKGWQRLSRPGLCGPNRHGRLWSPPIIKFRVGAVREPPLRVLP